MQTITKVYDRYDQAKKAVNELEAAGIPSADISLMANKTVSDRYADVDNASDTATGAGIGAVAGGTAGLLAGLGLMAIPGLGPVVAAGWFASTALGALAGGAAGGLIGALVDAGVPEETAHVYSEAVRRGGTLLTVRADDVTAGRVNEIVGRFRPIDAVKYGADYRKSGWTRFDPNAGPYEARTEREQTRRAS